ncbi:hypothetical protein [Encephalitozoon cuniculi GB-M1]|uniref:Protein-S-isoprenylcysteine O-methyltransferase n=2 Tax=Encephalitozoon cuniculi TaxID=6035 RepID=Q8SWI1_ENCCU|nr:uncharacterized protein ECU01_1350 [Encephalitozoon cuniculi GB-M1]AGE96081.1 hypothetical protein ECU01_1350 [Encephalitozoon cuniculi]KMV66791.1 hypothetical protein M970_011210 [Encephalitozoon cuniculi EcunIII-L]UYI28509.1 putative protein-S-isoprenylcysteine methyltransferase [Encephalitozoon cuniculi]CAD25008.1 hypothetical protein [Encephalitozoon cuniculi GB-M1]
MECPSFYFALGSLFMAGISRTGCYPLLHIVSSISLLVFVYSREKARNIDFGMKILKHNDSILLFGSLFLESLLISRSAGRLGTRVFKAIAACGLTFSITLFCFTLRYVADNKVEGKKIQRSGPYKYARHPLYSALILYWASCCTYLSCFISLAAFLWFVNNRIFPRIKEREREMISISSEYTEYRKAVWSGIPMYK